MFPLTVVSTCQCRAAVSFFPPTSTPVVVVVVAPNPATGFRSAAPQRPLVVDRGEYTRQGGASLPSFGPTNKKKKNEIEIKI